MHENTKQFPSLGVTETKILLSLNTYNDENAAFLLTGKIDHGISLLFSVTSRQLSTFVLLTSRQREVTRYQIATISMYLPTEQSDIIQNK
jgi:hypothetical protein